MDLSMGNFKHIMLMKYLLTIFLILTPIHSLVLSTLLDPCAMKQLYFYFFFLYFIFPPRGYENVFNDTPTLSSKGSF